MFRVRAKSRYDELWRYNLVMSCAGIGVDGEVLYVTGNSRVISEEFYPHREVMPLVPADFIIGEPLDIDCEPAPLLRLLLYVIPYLFPDDILIDKRKPFQFVVEVFSDGELLCSREFDVNCWSGASIDFTIDIEDEKVSK
ncbi:MAG: hypothetical protein SNG35_02855 [Rikenellaceae bacterium]